MSEPSDTNSTLSISSDSDSAGANDESPSPIEPPKITSMVQIQHAEGFAPEETGGNGRRKEDYEEYFMSVNQHKKSLRGEKLIVTKKSETSRSFKCIGWLFTVVLLGGAIAVAVLIGVGVIDTNPGKYKEGRFISSNTDKNGLSSSSKLLEVENPNAPNVLTNNPDFFNDDFPPKNAVLNVFSGELKITNMEWDPSLGDDSSEIFKIMATEIEEDLKKLFSDVPSDTNSQVMVKVNKFRAGSVRVKYTVGWLADNDILTASIVRARVISQLRLGNGKLFGKFEMSVDSVVVDYVLDQCSVLQCSHQCQYYFNQLRFICLCPDKRNNANYVECKVDQGNNGLQETGITDTTVASTSTSQSTSTSTTTTTTTTRLVTTVSTSTARQTTKTTRTTTTPAPVIVFPVNFSSPARTPAVVTTSGPATTEISVTDRVVTTSSSDQPWTTGQTDPTTTSPSSPTDEDNEDKSTTGAPGATTETPQSTIFQFTEGEIASVNLPDVETEKFFIGESEITTSSPEEEVTLGGWKEIQSTTLALSDLIRGTVTTAEPSQPSGDVTTAGEMINDVTTVTTSQDDIADELGGASTITTVSSGEETTSEPELITQNYKIIFAPSTQPVISTTDTDTTTVSASSAAEQTTTEPDTTTDIRTTESVPQTVTTTEEPETTTVQVDTCPGSVECEGVCLARYQVCDTLAHCGAGEDEADCQTRPSCLSSEFSCGGGRCIPTSWLCDGRPDCPAGEDEAACSTSCSAGEVQCGQTGQCIGQTRLCDGVVDCEEAEDEADCQCEAGELRCSWGGGCVPAASRCDGVYDCGDRSDEWNCVQLDNTTLTIASLTAGHSPVCSDQWSQDWSEQTCRQLGYLGPANSSTSYDFNLVDSDFWFRNTSVPVSGNLVQKSSATESLRCRSKEKVELTCAGFECGRWNLTDSVETLLVGGEADLESGSQWPSLAVLFNVRRKTSCTVTIVSPRWLVTSYSCVHTNSVNPLEWVVFAGPSGYSPTASESAQIKLVKSIVSHPGARRTQHLVDLDLAMVEIHDGLSFNTLVSPLCLADTPVQERQLCVTAGWTSSSQGISFNQYLTYLPVSQLPGQVCNSSSLYNGHLPSSSLCSKANGDSRVCHTDLGSPLMCLTEAGQWQLQAVLSSRGDCPGSGSRVRPAVFTNIVLLRDWIYSTIGSSMGN